MEIRINDYSDSFINLEKMIESVVDLAQVVAICLGRIAFFFKKEPWWVTAIAIALAIISDDLVDILLCFIPGGMRVKRKQGRRSSMIAITKDKVYTFIDVGVHKNIDRFTYQDLYIIGRKEMKRESSFDVSSIPSVSSVGKAVAGKVKKAAILKKFHVKLKIKGKDTMLIDSGFTSKKGYEKLLDSGKVISLSEAARLYFS